MPQGGRGGNLVPHIQVNNTGIYVAASCFAIVGGNWNNTLLEGAFCVNLNNTVSNSNTNNGAVQSYLIRN